MSFDYLFDNPKLKNYEYLNRNWYNEYLYNDIKTPNPDINEVKKPKDNNTKFENDKQNTKIGKNEQENNKINKNTNNKKELNDGPKDNNSQNKNENGNKTEDIQKTMDEYYEELLKKKEFRLLTDSQYVTLENRIGENACYVNVIIHFLYIFPCVNDYLIKKYKEKVEKDLKEKEIKEKKLKEKEIKEKELKEKELKEKEPNKNIQNNQNNKEEKDININQKENNNNETKTPNDNNNNQNMPINTKIIEKEKKKSIGKKPTKKDDNFNEFLFYLGKILNDYQNILITIDNKENIIRLNTNQLRKSLSISSNNLFKLNSISDPVEFLIYILDLINKENFEEIHSYFHLNLIEEKRCSNFCPNKIRKKFDKDNFIYQIYVEDIINYIKKSKIDFDNYKENLFLLSYYSLQNEHINCEKCNSPMNNTLICNNKQGFPKFLLINCVWNNYKPEIEDVVKFLFLISLVEEIDNLFICPNKVEKDNYYLMGIIFYCFTLCHYINTIFNLQKNVFTLYNDEGVLEFKYLNDLFKYITIEQIKKNNQAYFYPVLLVYGKENIYDENSLPIIKRFNNKDSYEKLIKECKEEIKKTTIKIDRPLTEEEKQKNYNELVEAQKKYDREQYINELLNKNKGNKGNNELSDYTDYFKRFNNDSERKLNIINNGQINKNNFLRSNNNKKTKYVSVDKKPSNNYLYINDNNDRNRKKSNDYNNSNQHNLMENKYGNINLLKPGGYRYEYVLRYPYH